MVFFYFSIKNEFIVSIPIHLTESITDIESKTTNIFSISKQFIPRLEERDEFILIKSSLLYILIQTI